MPSSKKTFGNEGEKSASDFLCRNGYSIIEKNYRTRYGEIDIIAKDGGTVVFVEVKTRRGSSLYGPPEFAVDSRKQNQIIKTALSYIAFKKINSSGFRFDVVSITRGNGKDRIELIKNAFSADGFWDGI